MCFNNLLNNSQFGVVLCRIRPAHPHLHRNQPGVGEEGADYGQRQTDGSEPVGLVGAELFVNFSRQPGAWLGSVDRSLCRKFTKSSEPTGPTG